MCVCVCTKKLIQMYWLNLVISMLLVIPVAIKIFYPIYFNLDLTSCYEYLGIRFGKNIRVFGAILYIIQVDRNKS